MVRHQKAGAEPTDHLHRVTRLAVQVHGRRLDPVGELAPLCHLTHQAGDISPTFVAGQPLIHASVPFGLRHDTPIGRYPDAKKQSDVAVKCFVQHHEPNRNASLVEHFIPAFDAGHRVVDVVVAQHLVNCVEHQDFLLN